MSNVYLVKVVGTEQVVGLAVEHDGRWIGTSYAASRKTGVLAPTTAEAVKSAVVSGAIPLPPAELLRVIGMSKEQLTEEFADEGEVYYEHALAV